MFRKEKCSILKLWDKLAWILRTMLFYFLFNNVAGHVISYDRRAFTVYPVRLTTDFPYVFGLHQLQFRATVLFQKYDSDDWHGSCCGSPKGEGIYVNFLRDEQVGVVWTLIGSGGLMCDTDEESEGEKVRSSVIFFWMHVACWLLIWGHNREPYHKTVWR